MNATLREKVQGISETAAEMLSKALKGDTKIDGGLFDRCIRLVSAGLKVEHMNQLKDANDKSFGLRLLQFMPKDQDTRNRYIELTNPNIRPLLMNKNKK